MKELEEDGNLPQHIAVIMDGNGRWAKKQGAARIFGHRNAIQAVRDTTEFCAENQINYLTLYAFSTENWSRPKYEVEGLMQLLVTTINSELPTLQKNNVRLLSIGDTKGLPKATYNQLQAAIEETRENNGLQLILALNYSGKWDITQAVKKISGELAQGEITLEDIDDDLIKSRLSTADFPDPELMIRTSGEMRISNFLLWELAYAELYFTDVLWPDFRKDDLRKAIDSFRKRERRFGKTSEQVTV